MRLPHSTSARLQSLFGLLVTPFEAESIDTWRDQVARLTRDVVGGHYSQLSLDPVCGLATIRSPDVDPAAIAEYQREWVHRDPLPARLVRRGPTAYVRSISVAQDDTFRATYEASPILNDFYRRLHLYNAAGVLRRSPDFAQLTVFTARETDERFVARSSAVMPMIAPVFLASTRQIISVASIQGHFARNVDALRTALAIYDERGECTHRNRALTALLAEHDERDELARLLDHAARTLARSGATTRAAASAETLFRWRHVRVSASRASLGIDGSPPMLLVQAWIEQHAETHAPAPSSTDRTTPASQLTSREREVCVLLVRGLRNREIAQSLGTTEHTARRHTERILRKLGLTSRSGVAAALGWVSGLPEERAR